jgi:hypothetical protein
LTAVWPTARTTAAPSAAAVAQDLDALVLAGPPEEIDHAQLAELIAGHVVALAVEEHGVDDVAAEGDDADAAPGRLDDEPRPRAAHEGIPDEAGAGRPRDELVLAGDRPGEGAPRGAVGRRHRRQEVAQRRPASTPASGGAAVPPSHATSQVTRMRRIRDCIVTEHTQSSPSGEKVSRYPRNGLPAAARVTRRSTSSRPSRGSSNHDRPTPSMPRAPMSLATRYFTSARSFCRTPPSRTTILDQRADGGQRRHLDEGAAERDLVDRPETLGAVRRSSAPSRCRRSALVAAELLRFGHAPFDFSTRTVRGFPTACVFGLGGPIR